MNLEALKEAFAEAGIDAGLQGAPGKRDRRRRSFEPTPPRHCTKKGPGRASGALAPLLPVGMKMLKGVTSAPAWPGGKAYTAKQSLRRSMGTL